MSEKFFSVPGDRFDSQVRCSSGGNNAHAELKVVDLGDKKRSCCKLASVRTQENGPIENLSAWMVVRDDSPTPKANIRYQFFRPLACMRDGSGIFVGTVQGPIPIEAGEKLCFPDSMEGKHRDLSFCPSIGVMPDKSAGYVDRVESIPHLRQDGSYHAHHFALISCLSILGSKHGLKRVGRSVEEEFNWASPRLFR